jgi:hypothetical protein
LLPEFFDISVNKVSLKPVPSILFSGVAGLSLAKSTSLFDLDANSFLKAAASASAAAS